MSRCGTRGREWPRPAVVLLTGGVGVGGATLLPLGAGRAVAFYLIAGAFLLVATLARPATSAGDRRPWQAMLRGLLLLTVAGFLRDVLPGGGTHLVFVTAVLLGGPLVASGIVKVLRSDDRTRTPESLVDAGIVAVAAAAVGWAVLHRSVGRSPEVGSESSLALMLVGLEGIGVWLLVRRIFDAGRVSLQEAFVMAALALPVGGLVVVAMGGAYPQVMRSSEAPFNFMSYVSVAAAAVSPSPTTRGPRVPGVGGGRRLAGIVLALLVPPGVATLQQVTTGAVDLVGLLLGATLLTVLSGFRIAMTVTRLETSYREREREQRRFTALISNSADPILVADAAFRLAYLSPAARDCLGSPAAGAPLVDFFHDSDRPAVSSLLLALASHPGSTRRARLRIRAAGSRTRWVDAAFVSCVDDGVGIVVNWTDVTEQQQAAVRLDYLSRHDDLTNLLNRRAVVEHIEAILLGPGWTCVLFCDLDGFKAVNDTFGHEIGDLVLVEVANRLRAACREGEVVGRMGGDEFVMCCGGLASPGQAEAIVVRVRNLMTAPFVLGGQVLEQQVGISIGVGLAPPGGASADALLARADDAMYADKRAGSIRTLPGPRESGHDAQGASKIALADPS